MEFTNLDKKNIEKMYKKYGERLVSKIVKKQDKLKMSDSLRSTMRKMRKQEGGMASKLNDYRELIRTGDPNCKICDDANLQLKYVSQLQDFIKEDLPEFHRNPKEVENQLYDKIYWFKDYEDKIIDMELSGQVNNIEGEKLIKKADQVIPSMKRMLKDNCTVKYKDNSGYLNFDKIRFHKKKICIYGKDLGKKFETIDKEFIKTGKEGLFRKFKKFIEIEKKESSEKHTVVEHLINFLLDLRKLINEPVLEIDLLTKEKIQRKNYEGIKELFPNFFKRIDESKSKSKLFTQNPNIDETYSLEYNPNLQPMQQLPVAVQQPVAVQPVAVQPVAVQPVAVQPVAVQPVAVQPVAVQPVAQQ
jgi:hypothetical protein